MILERCLRGLIPVVVGLVLTAGGLRAEQPFAKYPQTARDRYVKGEELRLQGKYREALKAFEEAIELGLGTYARVYLRQADCHQHLAEYTRVVAAYTRVIEDFGLERSCLL
jgi:tetratricopeptide (TPR) repeat protein